MKADIILGVVPQQSPLKLFKIWKPVAKYLSEEIGEKVHFKTEKSIKVFSEKLYQGKYDLAYMNALQFVLVNTNYKYEALVRSDKLIRGILVMRKSDSLSKYQGQKLRILFPSPVAFAATILMKYDLLEKYNIDLQTIKNARYVNSHDSVYRGIARGLGDIGGGIERTFAYKDNQPLHKKIKIVHTSTGYPTHPFAVRKTVSKKVKDKLKKALLNMPKYLLQKLNMKRLKEVKNSDYLSVEKLAKKLNISVE